MCLLHYATTSLDEKLNALNHKIDMDVMPTLEDVQSFLSSYEGLDRTLSSGGDLPSYWKGGDDDDFDGTSECPRCGCKFDVLNEVMEVIQEDGPATIKIIDDYLEHVEEPISDIDDAYEKLTKLVSNTKMTKDSKEEFLSLLKAVKDSTTTLYNLNGMLQGEVGEDCHIKPFPISRLAKALEVYE